MDTQDDIRTSHGAGFLGRIPAAVRWTGCILLLAALTGGPAAGVDYRDQDISVTAEPTDIFNQTWHGYVEYRLRVENHSDRSRQVGLVLESPVPHGNGYLIQRISRDVTVAAKGQMRVSLFQPPVALMWTRMVTVKIDQKKQEERVPLDIQDHGSQNTYGMGQLPLCILASRNLRGDLAKAVEPFLPEEDSTSTSYHTVIRSGRRMVMPSTTSAGGRVEIRRSESPVGNWSRHWLGYSRFDAVICGAEELAEMPPAVRDALEQYTECGGTWVIVGPADVPAAWQKDGYRDGPITQYHPGFGACLVLSQTDAAAWPEATWQRILSESRKSQMPWHFCRSMEQAQRALPATDKVGIPTRGLFVIILLFALLIGPVNLIFLSRKGRRMRLFWTVPLFSLLTSLGVLSYALLAEGVRGHCRSISLTVLDERTHRAVTVGWMGYYCPVTPGGGLVCDYQTEIHPQLEEDDWRPREDRFFTINWTAAQHLDSGWITSRVPAHFMVRKHEIRRERLSLRTGPDGAGLQVVNGLGAPVRWLCLADADGNIWQANGIEPGAAGTLVRMNAAAAADGSVSSRRGIFEMDWLVTLDQVAKEPRRFLQRQTYLAELAGPVFVEPGLAHLKETRAKTLVYGIMEGAADAR